MISRGLEGDKGKLCDILRSVNYYRLTGFLFPFKEPETEFYVDVTVDKLWAIYTFDRRLRGLLFECLARLEVALRTLFAHEHALATGSPFCYADPKAFDLKTAKRQSSYENMLKRIDNAVDKARELRFMEHFFANYNHSHPPIWMTIEVVTFGVLQYYFKLMPDNLRIRIAQRFGFHRKTFLTILTALNRLRNACAHHERLVNTKIPTDGVVNQCSVKRNPMLADLDEALAVDDEPPKDGMTLYALVCIMTYLLSLIRPESQWRDRFMCFMDASESDHGRAMLPVFKDAKWKTCALWLHT